MISTNRLLRSVAKLINSVVKSGLRIRNATLYILRGDFRGFITRFGQYRKSARLPSAVCKRPLAHQRWGVMATKHTLFIAHLVVENLHRHRCETEIMTSSPKSFQHDFYVVICPQMFLRLPPGEKRIAFQMEQSVSSRWFTKNYMRTLMKSLAVLEYSLTNIDFLSTHGIHYPHIYYMPVGASLTYSSSPPPEKSTHPFLR